MNREIFQKINLITQTTVRFRKNTDKIIEEVSKLLEDFATISTEERASLKQYVTDDVAAKMLVISCRFAERALDENNEYWIDKGILSHILEGFRSEYRENYRCLVVLDHAARSMNYPLVDVFEKYRDIANPVTQSRMDAFFSRDPALNKLSVFGLTERQTPDGIIIAPA